ncbi:hypothetical protein M8J77_009177 [Diaphorina citri]|nr:hypothetical protein M8J77_009177 [Diaphorina citri]
MRNKKELIRQRGVEKRRSEKEEKTGEIRERAVDDIEKGRGGEGGGVEEEEGGGGGGKEKGKEDKGIVKMLQQVEGEDGLRRRMDKLKSSIEEANHAVDQERETNVSLLHMIFPPDIAKRLWLGESIEAKTHEHVTMLFSDIVGFTSICSTATPFMVISMLENLYNKFDAFCGQLDVYKYSSAIL